MIYSLLISSITNTCIKIMEGWTEWRTERGVRGVQTPPPEIPKALQNRAKLTPIVKTVKNC